MEAVPTPGLLARDSHKIQYGDRLSSKWSYRRDSSRETLLVVEVLRPFDIHELAILTLGDGDIDSDYVIDACAGRFKEPHHREEEFLHLLGGIR